MKVLADTREKVLHDVLRWQLRFGELALHDRYQLGDDFTLLVAVEQVSYRPWREDAVEVLEECLLFDVLIGEDERRSFALDPACPVQHFQILQKVTHVVRAWPQNKRVHSSATYNLCSLQIHYICVHHQFDLILPTCQSNHYQFNELII